MQAAPGQLRERRKPLAQIARERRDLARPWRPRAIGRRLQATLDVFAHRLAVEPHLAGDRRDAHALPMQFKDHHDLPKSDQRRAPPHGKAPSSVQSSRPLAAGSSQLTWGKFNRHIWGVFRRHSQMRLSMANRAAIRCMASSAVAEATAWCTSQTRGAQQATSSSAASLPGHEGW